MRLVYQQADGLKAHVDLTDEPLVIGRSPDAGLVLADDKVSRMHCGIRNEGGQYLLKDLGSRNGTFLNAEKLERPVPLKTGDHIRIGHTLLSVQEKLAKGCNTILHEIEEEMGHGKGYRTILREIVEPNEKD